MTKGDLLADLVSHGDMSRVIVELHGMEVHARMMGLLMRSPWHMDAEVHYYYRPHPLAPDGVIIELECEGVSGKWSG